MIGLLQQTDDIKITLMICLTVIAVVSIVCGTVEYKEKLETVQDIIVTGKYPTIEDKTTMIENINNLME